MGLGGWPQITAQALLTELGTREVIAWPAGSYSHNWPAGSYSHNGVPGTTVVTRTESGAGHRGRNGTLIAAGTRLATGAGVKWGAFTTEGRGVAYGPRSSGDETAA